MSKILYDVRPRIHKLMQVEFVLLKNSGLNIDLFIHLFFTLKTAHLVVVNVFLLFKNCAYFI